MPNSRSYKINFQSLNSAFYYVTRLQVDPLRQQVSAPLQLPNERETRGSQNLYNTAPSSLPFIIFFFSTC